MTKTERAKDLFDRGFNCAASVFAAFAEDYDVETETALKLTGGFGGGCTAGDICGAASGAILVIGLKYGQYIENDQSARTNCHARTSGFIDAFKEANGALDCRDLLAKAPQGGGDETVSARRSLCAAFVERSARILEDLGY